MSLLHKLWDEVVGAPQQHEPKHLHDSSEYETYLAIPSIPNIPSGHMHLFPPASHPSLPQSPAFLHRYPWMEHALSPRGQNVSGLDRRHSADFSTSELEEKLNESSNFQQQQRHSVDLSAIGPSPVFLTPPSLDLSAKQKSPFEGPSVPATCTTAARIGRTFSATPSVYDWWQGDA